MMIDVAEFDGPALMLRARGRINVLTADLFEFDALQAVARSDHDVIMDASDVSYVSTAGLRVFLLLSRELNDRGRSFHVFGLLPHIHRVFEIIGFDRVIPLHPNVDSALAAIEGKAQS